MSVTIVIGGQYGSEGKGKVVALTARGMRRPWVVRCGGPNSGHSTCINGEERVLRQLPSAAGQADATLAIAAGCVVDEQLLIHEISACGLAPGRVVVDPRAVLLEDADRRAEEETLVRVIGSTGSGNGRALARRLLRSSDVRLAGSSRELAEFATIETLAPQLHELADAERDIVIEGSQGFGLSLLHGPDYPFVTGKDTSAAAFASEVGLSPRLINSIVMVIRTFPIRVGGPSGPLAHELSWEDVQRASGAPKPEPEYTSVTRRLRRVGRFDLELVKAAARYNHPTSLAVMGLDRLDYRNRGAGDMSALTHVGVEFLNMLKHELGVPVQWVGTGFGTLQAMDLQRAPMHITNV